MAKRFVMILGLKIVLPDGDFTGPTMGLSTLYLDV